MGRAPESDESAWLGLGSGLGKSLASRWFGVPVNHRRGSRNVHGNFRRSANTVNLQGSPAVRQLPAECTIFHLRRFRRFQFRYRVRALECRIFRWGLSGLSLCPVQSLSMPIIVTRNGMTHTWQCYTTNKYIMDQDVPQRDFCGANCIEID